MTGQADFEGPVGSTGALNHLDQAPRKYAQGVKLFERRTFDLDLRTAINPADVENWLLGAASKSVSANALVEGFACRLAQARLGVERFLVNVGTLHPQISGYSWVWSSLDAICDEIQIATETLTTDAFRNNPISRVVEHGEVFRILLSPEATGERSPLMEELAETGYSEYIAMPLSARSERYNAVTMATRQSGGFTEVQYDNLLRLLSVFALHVERHIASRITENIAIAYLGRSAGERVVSGSIKRGSGLPIQAIVWSSDMRDFSTLSERMSNQAVVELLNRYFLVLAEAVMRHGGDVLKFIGDGMLAVFPLADFDSPQKAARAASTAAREAVEDLDALNRAMAQTADWERLQSGIGLHLGEVFFGNVGAARRLDFTVVGDAVNTASRIEGLCKVLKRDVLMSASVASLIDEGIEDLGAQSLKGLRKTEQVFSLSRDI